MPGTRHPGRLDNESGSMLIELILAMLFLAVAVGALVSVYSASVVSLRHTSIEGNALTLVDRQIELYNTLPYAFISLDSTTIPGSTDSYTTAHSTDSTIPGALGQVTGTTVAPGSCTSPKAPQPSCATQLVAGPDGRTYRIDTYIVFITPPTAGSRAVKQVTSVARLVQSGTVGPIRARIQSAYDQCNPPTAAVGSTC